MLYKVTFYRGEEEVPESYETEDLYVLLGTLISVRESQLYSLIIEAKPT